MFNNFFTSINKGISDAEKLAQSVKRFRFSSSERITMTEGNIYAETYENAQIQMFGNENNCVWPQILKMVPRNPKVVGIAASADWLIDCITFGARDFVCIDINTGQIYMCMLKILAHAVLTYDEFWEFMMDPHSENCMSFEVISRIFSQFEGLPYKVAFAFWKRLYELSDFNSKTVRMRYIACEKMYMDIPYSKRNPGGHYLASQFDYEYSRFKLRRALPKVNLYFENGNIYDSEILDKYVEKYGKFDIWYTSNTFDYAVPDCYLQDIYRIMEKYVDGITVIYVIQLSSYEIQHGPIEPSNIVIGQQHQRYAKTILDAISKMGYCVRIEQVYTCDGLSNIMNGKIDSIALIFKR